MGTRTPLQCKNSSHMAAPYRQYTILRFEHDNLCCKAMPVLQQHNVHAGVIDVLTEALKDKNERVRRRIMATLGELLFYVATQQQVQTTCHETTNPALSVPAFSCCFIPAVTSTITGHCSHFSFCRLAVTVLKGQHPASFSRLSFFFYAVVLSYGTLLTHHTPCYCMFRHMVPKRFCLLSVAIGPNR